MKRSTLLMMLPALVVGVFLLMSTPYLKVIMEKALAKDPKLQLRSLTLTEEPEAEEEVAPPPSPESEMARFYQEQFDKEGFDWRSLPEAPEQDMGFVKDKPIEIAPLEVELPLTMTELKEASASE